MTRCSQFSFKAVCTWKPEKKVKDHKFPSGFSVHCSNPEVETERHGEYEEAFESFRNWVSDFVKILIPSGSPEVTISDPVFRGKSENCSGDSGGFTLDCAADEITISWIFTISHQPNRSLDEFEQVVEKYDNMVQDLKDDGITFTVTPHGETA